MNRIDLPQQFQNDVNAWPQRVRDAGVTNMGGAAYVPVSRNNEILRTPDNPEATFAYVMRVWGPSKAGSDIGSQGWYRIIAQAGPELTWEWLIADATKPYASLFPDEMRQRIRRALEADTGYTEWTERRDAILRAERERTESRERVRDEIRAGKRKRPRLPELDAHLSGRN